jgi:hypothetical protein
LRCTWLEQGDISKTRATLGIRLSTKVIASALTGKFHSGSAASRLGHEKTMEIACAQAIPA